MTQQRELMTRLERGFNPRNVAVIGAARHNNFGWIRRHLPIKERGGRLFHVNIDKNEWPGAEELGAENLLSLMDTQEPIDYVAISVPRQAVPPVLQDCINKGVAVVHIFTAGFGESKEEEGIRLEQRIADLAKQAGLPIIGPNCVGLFNPAAGIRQGDGQYYGEGQSGYLGYIANSGSQALGIVSEALAHGIRISKCFSMGNGLVLDQADFIDYLAQDDATKVIGLYVEGLRTPDRFFRSLREACKKKPVIVWKVGQTEDGARAVAAHSGTAYFPQGLWSSLVARCGALQVNSIEEMIDTVKAAALVPPARGYNVGLFAATGGHSTEMANAFSRGGFKVAPFSEQTYVQLRSFLSLIGGNHVNPIEGGGSAQHLDKILDLLRVDPNIDVVAVELAAGPLTGNAEQLAGRTALIKHFREQSTKPIIVVNTLAFPRVDSFAGETIGRAFHEQGVAAFSSFDRAASALKNVVDYHAMRSYLGD